MNNQLQNLLQDTLISTAHVENSAIFRRKDVLLRGNSIGYTLSIKEMELLNSLFQNLSETRSGGFTLKNIHYKIIRVDKYSIYGKKDKQGLAIIRTATLVIVASFSNEMFPGVCIEAVEKLGDYLREKGK